MPFTSAKMGLQIPVVSVDDGPAWAQLIDLCLQTIDAHSHAPGSGVQITPAGLSINADLPVSGNNVTALRSARFNSQAAQLVLATDVGCLYMLDQDLWFIDGAGHQVRITQSGSVRGAAGTIAGLPSGTASASYLAGTFTFLGATNTPAAMAVGPVSIGTQNAGSKTVTINANPTQSANYGITLPAAAPAAAQTLVSDQYGGLSWSTAGIIPLGGVIATFPSLSGAYSCSTTTSADANGFVLCAGFTISDATSPMYGITTPAINNDAFLMGHVSSGPTGGNNTLDLSHSHTVNAHSHSYGHSHTTTPHSHILPFGSYPGTAEYFAVDASISLTTPLYGTAPTLTNYYPKSWSYSSSFGGAVIPLLLTSQSSTSTNSQSTTDSGTASPATDTQLSASQDIRPNYVSAVFVMRIK
jgi:hypothetical protein